HNLVAADLAHAVRVELAQGADGDQTPEDAGGEEHDADDGDFVELGPHRWQRQRGGEGGDAAQRVVLQRALVFLRVPLGGLGGRDPGVKAQPEDGDDHDGGAGDLVQGATVDQLEVGEHVPQHGRNAEEDGGDMRLQALAKAWVFGAHGVSLFLVVDGVQIGDI